MQKHHLKRPFCTFFFLYLIFYDLFSFLITSWRGYNSALLPSKGRAKASSPAAKTEMRVQTFDGQHFSFHVRQQQTGISKKNSWPWVTGNQVFTLVERQQKCEDFCFLRTYMVKISSGCWRAAMKMAPENADLLGYSSKAVELPQGMAWRTEI